MENSFPSNPSDLQIIEVTPGTFYQYSAAIKSWIHIPKPTIPLATYTSPGLMSAEDYKKLTNIILPPPQCTITAGGCKIESGLIGLQGDGIINVEVSPDNISENTGLINISLDTEKLIDKLKELGKFRVIDQPGPKGLDGDPGDPGMDALPVGPYGDDGDPGKPIEWPGGLVEEGINIKDDNRAIVEVSTEEISPTENYLVVKRANIGNPHACPNTIKPKDVQSPWLLAFANMPLGSTRGNTEGQIACSQYCTANIYYLNIENIINTIRNQFISYLKYEKAKKEEYAQEVVDEMIASFDEQKAALGCALEACRSVNKNTEDRRYIESQKIQAAQGGYNLHVASTGTSGYVPSAYKACDYTVVSLEDPDVPIVNPDGLKQGPIK